MNRILLLKKLDAVLGRLATALLPASPRVSGPVTCRRILVIRPGGIGDAVLLVPLLRRLKETWPEAGIEVLAEQRNAAIFSLCPVVERVWRYDRGDLPAVLRACYDLVIDSEQWHRLSAVVARLIRAQMRIGFGTNERRKLFNQAVDYAHNVYEVDSFFRLLQPLDLVPPQELHTPFLTIPDEDREHARDLLRPLAGRPFVVLFPGASIAERRWGSDRFRQLAERLNAAGTPVVVIGGREDRAAGEAIVAGNDGLNLAGDLSLPGSAAIIAAAAVLVSGDSGLLHVGVGLGRPTVSLFGSGIATKWAPRGAGHVVLDKGLPCSPCTRFGTTPPCPIGVRCLAEISVDEVHAAVVGLMRWLDNREG